MAKKSEKKLKNQLTIGPNDSPGVFWARSRCLHLPCRLFSGLERIYTKKMLLSGQKMEEKKGKKAYYYCARRLLHCPPSGFWLSYVTACGGSTGKRNTSHGSVMGMPVLRSILNYIIY